MAPTTRNESSSVAKSESDKILDFLSKLDSKIDKVGSEVKTNLDKQTVKLRQEFQKHLSEFDDKLLNVINEQSAKISVLETVNENNERLTKLNDVIIKGVPTANNEKLFEVFDKISKVIKFGQSKFMSLNNIFRLRPTSEGRPSPILLQFTTQLLKREFMSKYFAHGSLKLSDIGFSSDARIYACDNLTKRNNAILQAALTLVAKKQITKARTRAGYVYVQFLNATDFVWIKDADELVDIGIEQLDTTVREQM